MNRYLIAVRCGLVFFICLLAGCNHVMVTQSIEHQGYTPHGVSCSSDLGSYFLPKGELTITVTQTTDAPSGSAVYGLLADEPKVDILADPKHHYCLEYRRNGFASDTIGMTLDDERLLHRVFSRNEDKSPDVILSVAGIAAEIAANAEARNARFRQQLKNASTSYNRRFQFDPFSGDELIKVNRALEDAGFCLFLDPTDDAFVPQWMGDLCGQGTHSIKSPAKEISEESSYQSRRMLENIAYDEVGILYRPFIQHSLIVMRKFDPGSGDPWTPWKRLTLSMPNRAPTMALRIKRTVFNTRKTEIEFASGSLQSVKINKKSSVRGATQILVGIVNSIVGIPVRALTIGINDAQNQAAIIDANAKLIEAQNNLLNAQKTAKTVHDFPELSRAQLNDRALLACTRNHTTLDRQAAFEECSQEYGLR